MTATRKAPRKGAVELALDRDLRRLTARDKALAQGALAAAARAIARELDHPNSATSKSMCARELREALDRLWDLAPAKQESNAVDQLADQRRKRIADRARRAAAAGPARS